MSEPAPRRFAVRQLADGQKIELQSVDQVAGVVCDGLLELPAAETRDIPKGQVTLDDLGAWLARLPAGSKAVLTLPGLQLVFQGWEPLYQHTPAAEASGSAIGPQSDWWHLLKRVGYVVGVVLIVGTGAILGRPR